MALSARKLLNHALDDDQGDEGRHGPREERGDDLVIREKGPPPLDLVPPDEHATAVAADRAEVVTPSKGVQERNRTDLCAFTLPLGTITKTPRGKCSRSRSNR